MLDKVIGGWGGGGIQKDSYDGPKNTIILLSTTISFVEFMSYNLIHWGKQKIEISLISYF